MDRKTKIVTVIFVLTVGLFFLIGSIQYMRGVDRMLDGYDTWLSVEEQALLKPALKAKSAGDYIVERTDYGYGCRQMADGKLCKVSSTLLRDGE
jgi:hypothetical protein